MEKVIIKLDNISNADIRKIDDCLKNIHKIDSYEILPENNIILHLKYYYDMPSISRELYKNGYKIVTAILQKREYSIPILEAIIDKKLVEQEVLRENANFDLENFFVNQLDGALCVITKNKTFFASALINHYIALNSIYNLLYNDSDEMKEYNGYNDYSSWQESAVSFGNIVIQLCSNASNTCWLPEEMNTYQLLELKKILNQLNKIEQKHNIPVDVEIVRTIESEKNTNLSPEIFHNL